MSFDHVRQMLNDNDLKNFDNTISKFKMDDTVNSFIVDFTKPDTFIVKSEFNTKPYNGLVFFRDGEIAGTYCC